jgi:hypothetical protein
MPDPAEVTPLLEGLGPGVLPGPSAWRAHPPAPAARPGPANSGGSATIAVHLARCWAPPGSPQPEQVRSASPEPDPARTP